MAWMHKNCVYSSSLLLFLFCLFPFVSFISSWYGFVHCNYCQVDLDRFPFVDWLDAERSENENDNWGQWGWIESFDGIGSLNETGRWLIPLEL